MGELTASAYPPCAYASAYASAYPPSAYPPCTWMLEITTST